MMKERGYLSKTGPEGEVLFPVDGSIFIGSGVGCEVGVKDAAPRHCQLVRTAEGFTVCDLTGMKLTRVNNARIERHLLQEGDKLSVGSAEFKWTIILEAEAEPVAAERAPTRRRERPRSEPIPKIAPKPPSTSRTLILGGAAVGALVLLVTVIALLPWTSNEDRLTAKRATRAVRSDHPTPGSGAVSEAATVAPAPPRQDPGGVAVAKAPEPKKTYEPAPLVIQPLAPVVVPDLPTVKPADPGEPAARPLTGFALRYSTLLASIDRTLARGSGFEAMYKELLEASGASGGPRGTAEHLKALAASLKDAVACRDCSGGKIGCERCGGKGRVDLDCSTCQGQGRVRASGAVGDADVTVKCRNCEGKRIFRGVTCPSCARAGKTTCATCRGNVWPSDRCPRPECNAGRTPCPTCSGAGVTMEKCPYCVKGRVRAPGAVGNADVTMKCRNCEIDGQHGTGSFRQDCKTCSKTGKVTCTHCGGPFNRSKHAEAREKNKSVETGSKAAPADLREKDKPLEFGSRVMVSNKVYTVEKCGDCSAKGCDRCLGIGWRIRPVSDPSRVMD